MRANDLISFRHQKNDDPGLTAIWEDRKDAIEQIQVLILAFHFPSPRSFESQGTSQSHSVHQDVAIPWPGTALDSQDIKIVISIISYDIKCLNDYFTEKESSAFMFCSSTKDLKGSTVGNTVLPVVISREPRRPGHGINQRSREQTC